MEYSVLPRPSRSGKTDPRRDILGEGICYVPSENALYWVDIIDQRVNRYRFKDGTYDEWAVPEMIGWLIKRSGKAGFIAGLKSGFFALTLEPFSLDRIAAPEPNMPNNRMNDACADRHGNIWAGTMSMDGSRDDGALYRLDTDLSLHRMDAPYGIANGPAISPDGKTLYHTDSAKRCVYQFDLHDDGSLGPRKIFSQFEGALGTPDGMTVDCEGGIWIAHWGGSCVSRFTPQGKRERWITLPASQITRPCFAGENYNRLFVTCASVGVNEPLAGSVFEVDPGVCGLPPYHFGG